MPGTVSVVFGTRPEAIKLAPVVQALKANGQMDVRICVTAQHREMLDQVLDVFDITPDHDLDLMRSNQGLSDVLAGALSGLDAYFASEHPDLVVVQGDTTTVLGGTLAAFHRHIPVAHVEAGLRTGNLDAPWPEEANRILTTRLASLHFAPTQSNYENLVNEGVPPERIHVTGNTVVDALFAVRDRLESAPPTIPDLPQDVFDGRTVLITGHRRENFGQGLESICHAIRRLGKQYPETSFIYPVHMNPMVKEPVSRILAGQSNIHLIPPQPYVSFVYLMTKAHLILTDSGGVQEEAPSLGKPVLVMRETTERPEAVDAGTVRVVGTEENALISNVCELMDSTTTYEQMANAHNPYGDGKSAERIVAVIKGFLGGKDS
ncbi:MAG: UDP-N-acetylglucosamine 2-epimerase (non-hydrolyzing) [Kiritimatiellae bacterium]|nr:UDP-N-acetylglucosamine 2-epimerase (non-hydrolyzing) [Kiritimatiellia bacterium]